MYRGSAIPSLQGFYVFGDFGFQVLAFTWAGTGRCGNKTLNLSSQFQGVSGRLTSFGEDAAGELYFTMLDGKLYRIDAKL